MILREEYEFLATGRTESLFAEDLNRRQEELTEKLTGRSVAVVGAAGSIGSAVVRSLLRFRPGHLVLFDLSENNLVELVRSLRSDPDVVLPESFAALPIGLGSLEFDRYFAEQRRCDYFFNLAAMKHVRSEKDIYCLMRMLDTNVLFLDDFLSRVPYRFAGVFSVSSDKAANPANLMGASKMIMEQVLLSHAATQPFATARFANVAFSDGSLPWGFLQRIAQRQPLAAPTDVRRYFISHQEAGELCVLAGVTGDCRDVFFPKMAAGSDEKTFSGIAVKLLEKLGYEPVLFGSEEEARQNCAALIPQRKWPCCFLPSDTDGEKPYEEFHTSAETVDLMALPNIGIIKRDGAELDRVALEFFLGFARRAKLDPSVTKEDYVRKMSRVVPGLNHIEAGRSLDQKM